MLNTPENPEIPKILTPEAKLRLTLPFTPIETQPEIFQAFQIVKPHLITARKNYKLPKIDFKSSDVRLVDEKTFSHPVFSKSNGRSFFDTATGICYLKIPESVSPDLAQAIVLYELIHELGHKSSDGGIGEFSFILDEGCTDKFTQDLLERYVFPAIKNKAFFDKRREYIARQKPKVNGISLQEQDILYTGPDGALAYAYPAEMHVVNVIQEQKPEVYELVKAAYYFANTVLAGTTIATFYNDEIASLLIHQDAAPEVLEKLKSFNHP